MIKPTLRQLEIFRAVARHGSFSKASEAIHLTQPAVSMQVKQLEKTLGTPIFEHIGKQIRLTEAGRETLASAERILRELRELEQTLDDFKGLRGGHLTVSAVSTASVFAARLMARFRRRHPGVRLELNVVNREAVLKQLLDNVSDLALMGTPPEDLPLTAQAFMDNPLVIIAAPDHPLARQPRIALSAVAKQPMVVREAGSGTRDALEKLFREHGLPFRLAMEMNKNEAIKQAVEAGLGIGLVSLHTVQAELTGGRLVVLDVEGFPLERQWYLVQRRGKRLSPLARAFAQLVLAQTRQTWLAPTD